MPLASYDYFCEKKQRQQRNNTDENSKFDIYDELNTLYIRKSSMDGDLYFEYIWENKTIRYSHPPIRSLMMHGIPHLITQSVKSKPEQRPTIVDWYNTFANDTM